MSITRLLVIGLDGLEPSLVRRWVRSGDLPNLAKLRAAGRWGPLRSTLPAATFPAWTTFLTGVNPGQHGIFDFARFRPGTREVEFVGASIRRRPIVPTLASDAGLRVACLGFPGTYPPEPLNGIMVSGFDSPVAVGIDPSFVSPPSMAAELQKRYGRYVFADFAETNTWLPGWHQRAAGKLVAGLERRAAMANGLAREQQWDLFMVHFGESDTAAHHFWAFHDPSSPRRPGPIEEGLDDVLLDVYRRLDRAVGELVEATGRDATVLIASDHGFGGASDKVLYLNRWLAEQGWLRFEAEPRKRDRLRGAAIRAALTLMPGRLQERAWRMAPTTAGKLEGKRRMARIDWPETSVFSEELSYHPSLRLNVRGRWDGGKVQARDARSLADDVAAALGELRDPWTGSKVVERVWRREEIYEGPALEDAPDLLLEFVLDHGYSLNILSSGGPGPVWRRLERGELLGAKGAGMNGTHRRDGFWLVHGPRVAPRRKRSALIDMAPTALSALGLGLPDWMEGHPELPEADGAPAPEDTRPARVEAPRAYTEQQQRVIEDRLRRLGYL